MNFKGMVLDVAPFGAKCICQVPVPWQDLHLPGTCPLAGFASARDLSPGRIQLEGLVSAVKITEQHSLAVGYAVIFIHFADRKVQLRHYSNEELDAAARYYSDVEKSINNNEAAVVLVSDIKELQEAYPSYFLNASEFVQALRYCAFAQTIVQL